MDSEEVWCIGVFELNCCDEEEEMVGGECVSVNDDDDSLVSGGVKYALVKVG